MMIWYVVFEALLVVFLWEIATVVQYGPFAKQVRQMGLFSYLLFRVDYILKYTIHHILRPKIVSALFKIDG